MKYICDQKLRGLCERSCLVHDKPHESCWVQNNFRKCALTGLNRMCIPIEERTEYKLKLGGDTMKYKALRPLTVKEIRSENPCADKYKLFLKALVDVDPEYFHQPELTIALDTLISIAEDLGEVDWLVEKGFVEEKKKVFEYGLVYHDGYCELRSNNMVIATMCKNEKKITTFASSKWEIKNV